MPLILQQPRVPLVNARTGQITEAWMAFLTDLVVRVGGFDARTNLQLSDDIAAAVKQLSGMIATLGQQVEATQQALAALTQTVQTLSNSVDAIEKRVKTNEDAITALKSRADALEATAANHEQRIAALEAKP